MTGQVFGEMTQFPGDIWEQVPFDGKYNVEAVVSTENNMFGVFLLLCFPFFRIYVPCFAVVERIISSHTSLGTD